MIVRINASNKYSHKTIEMLSLIHIASDMASTKFVYKFKAQ